MKINYELKSKLQQLTCAADIIEELAKQRKNADVSDEIGQSIVTSQKDDTNVEKEGDKIQNMGL